MKFSHIDASLSAVAVRSATSRFTRIITELGCRKDNYHVGTGLGGNNFHLLILMGIDHKLSSSSKVELQWSLTRNRLEWGAQWLNQIRYVDIRHKLDEVVPTIAESRKYLALALEDISGTENLRSALEKNKEHFPQVMACLKGETYSFDKNLSNVDKLILACVMCQDLARDLDNGITKKVQYIGSALYEFPTEIILLSIRRHIQIDRLVRHNLDEDPVFVKTLDKVTKRVLDE